MPVNSDPDRPASCAVLVRSPACELHLLLQETKAVAPTSRNGDPPGKLRPDRLTACASCLPKLREARSCGLPHVCVFPPSHCRQNHSKPSSSTVETRYGSAASPQPPNPKLGAVEPGKSPPSGESMWPGVGSTGGGQWSSRDSDGWTGWAEGSPPLPRPHPAHQQHLCSFFPVILDPKEEGLEAQISRLAELIGRLESKVSLQALAPLPPAPLPLRPAPGECRVVQGQAWSPDRDQGALERTSPRGHVGKQNKTGGTRSSLIPARGGVWGSRGAVTGLGAARRGVSRSRKESAGGGGLGDQASCSFALRRAWPGQVMPKGSG